MDGPLAKLILARGAVKNPFNNPKYKSELKKWDKKLKDEGFKDIEPSNHKSNGYNLKKECGPRKQKTVKDWDKTLTFFLHLDCLLTHFTQMPKAERLILEMYSDGARIKDITLKSRCSDKYVRNKIKYYNNLVLAIMRMIHNTDPAPSLRLISEAVLEVTADADDHSCKNKAA